MDPDQQARRLAAASDGVITHAALRRCGLSPKQIRGRVNRGVLVPLHHHVFLIAGAAPTFRARTRAALLALGPTAFASHMTAAALWGIRRGEPEVIDITVPLGGPRRLAVVRVHRLRSAAEQDVRTKHGIRLSAPARTICELAATEPRDTVAYAIQEAAAKLRLTPDELRAAAGRWGKRPGARLLCTILEQEPRDEFTRSWAERRLRQILDRAGLPLPDHTNLVIAGHRCDAVYRNERLIIEVDGIGTHGTPVAFLNDRKMSTELTLDGWRVLRFTARQLDDEPVVVAVQIAQALRRPD